MNDWPTTRRFPRSLGEAFRDADYACALEHPPERPKGRWIILAAVIGSIWMLSVL